MGNINIYQLLFLLYFVCVWFVISWGYVSPPLYSTSSYLFALPPIIGYIGGIAVRSSSSSSSSHKHPNEQHPHAADVVDNQDQNGVEEGEGGGNHDRNRIPNFDGNDDSTELNIEDINIKLGCPQCNSKLSQNNRKHHHHHIEHHIDNHHHHHQQSHNINNNYFESFSKKNNTKKKNDDVNGFSDPHSSISSGIGGALIQSDAERDINEFLTANPINSLNSRHYQQQLQQQQHYQQQLKIQQQQQQFSQSHQQQQQHQHQLQFQNRYHKRLQLNQFVNDNFDPNHDIHSHTAGRTLSEKRIVKNLARVYKSINEQKPKEYYDYESFKPIWRSVEKYEIINKIGRGKYSEVFYGVDSSNNDTDVVIKILKPVQKLKIKREIKILETLRGGPNIIPLLDTIRDPQSKTCSLVFPLIRKTDIRELIFEISDYELKYYIYELLKAVDYTHSMGIIHRDIKPSNIAIDHQNRKLYLLDWGLAEYYHPYKTYNVKVATRHYKPPELLVNMYDYDYSLDMWSLGCLFAGLVLDRDPFFNGENNEDQLLKITKVLGTDDLYRYLKKYGLELSEELEQLIKTRPKKNWDRFIPYENEALVDPLAIDFLDKLLKYDPAERLTAKEAMDHPYFDELRQNKFKSTISRQD
eukprot:gene5028-6258_t